MSKSALKILDTAEKLFYQQSFVAVGVDLIRDQSGCSKTTMYTYFKNKNQLVQAVLKARDERFKKQLFEYIETAEGLCAIERIYDWHMTWFQQDTFKGCLFVRAVAEFDLNDDTIISIAQQHKQWIKALVLKHCTIAQRPELSELIYTLLEGVIARFLVDGYCTDTAKILKKNITQLFSA